MSPHIDTLTNKQQDDVDKSNEDEISSIRSNTRKNERERNRDIDNQPKWKKEKKRKEHKNKKKM
jgi:hypothetical protein